MPKSVDELRKELADAIIAKDGGITNANAKELVELGKTPTQTVKMMTRTLVGGIEVEVPLEGNVESVSIGATINLGTYNNVKMEVSASNGPYARYIFEQEIQPTIDLVKSVVKKVNAK